MLALISIPNRVIARFHLIYVPRKSECTCTTRLEESRDYRAGALLPKAAKAKFRSIVQRDTFRFVCGPTFPRMAMIGVKRLLPPSLPSPFAALDHSTRASRHRRSRLHPRRGRVFPPSCRVVSSTTFSRFHAESIEFPADFCSCARVVAHLSAVHTDDARTRLDSTRLGAI